MLSAGGFLSDTLTMRLPSYRQEQSNTESSGDNTGSGGVGGVGQKQSENDKWSAPGGSSNSGVGAQSAPKSDSEGVCLRNLQKDASAVVGASKGSRKSLPVGPSRSGGTGGGTGSGGGTGTAAGPAGPSGRQLEEAAIDHIPTDMSDTTDSEEQDKNLE